MAQKPISTAAAERMNLVAQDEIWKYRLKAENEARQNWAQNWGFLSTPFEEEAPESSTSGALPLGIVFQLIKCEEEPATPKPKIELPERFRIRPVTPVEKYIKVLPSPPVPKTTQGFIGWRSGVPGLNKCLEHDYEIRSCKGAYAKELNWPKQGIH
uniref:Ciliary microtubule inner protein 1 n=1 Tax=Bos taurus TaxID=9913 RepID=A0A3S5ZPE5_BOVIN